MGRSEAIFFPGGLPNLVTRWMLGSLSDQPAPTQLAWPLESLEYSSESDGSIPRRPAGTLIGIEYVNAPVRGVTSSLLRGWNWAASTRACSGKLTGSLIVWA